MCVNDLKIQASKHRVLRHLPPPHFGVNFYYFCSRPPAHNSSPHTPLRLPASCLRIPYLRVVDVLRFVVCVRVSLSYAQDGCPRLSLSLHPSRSSSSTATGWIKFTAVQPRESFEYGVYIYPQGVIDCLGNFLSLLFTESCSSEVNLYCTRERRKTIPVSAAPVDK